MTSSDIRVYLDALNLNMRQVVDSLLPGPQSLDVMLRYHLGWTDEHGRPTPGVYPGKQVRPTLVLLMMEVAGGDWHQAIPAAIAVELLHNFSLIHDDIEDSSPFRRGRPTVWSIWGIPDAINAGDAMFVLAYKALLLVSEYGGVLPERVVMAFDLFIRTTLALTRGQHQDMLFEREQRITVDEYLDMVTGKSAALLAASAGIGAVLAGVKAEERAYYADFGRNLGIAFQIRDDILGIWGDPSVTGKSAATDIVSKKKSLPVLFALERSEELAEIYASAELAKSDVEQAVVILNRVGAMQFAREQEEYYFRRALAALDAISGLDHALTLVRELVGSLVGRFL